MFPILNGLALLLLSILLCFPVAAVLDGVERVQVEPGDLAHQVAVGQRLGHA